MIRCLFSICSNGETNYSLKQAQDVKVRLTKLADTINFLGKKVLVLGIKDGDVKPHSSAIQLQRAIYLTSSNFLSDKLLGLPTLPSEEEVEKFRVCSFYTCSARK